MSEHFGRVFWQKILGERGIEYDADALVDHIVSHAHHPTATKDLLSNLEQSISSDDYPFLLHLIESGFHLVQADADRTQDLANARDYTILQSNLKTLARENKRLGRPFDLPRNNLDENSGHTSTAWHYELLLHHGSELERGGQCKTGTRHTITAVIGVLTRHMTKTKALELISNIFQVIYGDFHKSVATLKKRWT